MWLNETTEVVGVIITLNTVTNLLTPPPLQPCCVYTSALTNSCDSNFPTCRLTKLLCVYGMVGRLVGDV